MKRNVVLMLMLGMILSFCTGCTASGDTNQQGDLILATTYPVYYLTQRITEGAEAEEFHLDLMVTEQVSCLHDYSLTTTQMKKLDRARLVILSGAGMEEFLEDALQYVSEDSIVDSALGIDLLAGEHHEGHHGGHHDEHTEEPDPHIWMDPERYAQQGENICNALCKAYPAYADLFLRNTEALCRELLTLKEAGLKRLSTVSCRQLVTFHDGFAYFAQAFDLELLASAEVEDGASPSARDIRAIAEIIRDHQVPVVFEETYANEAAHISATTVASEAACAADSLNLFMGADGRSYTEVMNENIETLMRYLQ